MVINKAANRHKSHCFGGCSIDRQIISLTSSFFVLLGNLEDVLFWGSLHLAALKLRKCQHFDMKGKMDYCDHSLEHILFRLWMWRNAMLYAGGSLRHFN